MTRCAWILTLLFATNAYADKSAVAVLDIQGTGIDAALLPTLTEVLTVEIDSLGMYKVVAGRDVQAMLGFEKQKDMLGCTDAACLAEIGGALGVDRIVVSQIGKVGNTYVVNIKIINIRMADTEGRVYETVKGEVDALIETIKKSVVKLLGSGSKAALTLGATANRGGSGDAPRPETKPAAKAPESKPAVKAPETKPAAPPPTTVAQAPSTPPAQVEAKGAGRSIGILPIALWGVGGLAIIGGVVMGLGAKSAEEKANAKYAGDATGNTYDVGAQKAGDDAKKKALITNILFGVGIVAAGSGVALFLTSGSGSAATAALTPVVGPDNAGLALVGSF
ncbi:MAG: hypothetical protein HY903_19170 [Deltaproteobacteria bacterium]|nr:hypothetical protein [Deltaproteobacteria bacterium]